MSTWSLLIVTGILVALVFYWVSSIFVLSQTFCFFVVVVVVVVVMDAVCFDFLL